MTLASTSEGMGWFDSAARAQSTPLNEFARGVAIVVDDGGVGQDSFERQVGKANGQG